MHLGRRKSTFCRMEMNAMNSEGLVNVIYNKAWVNEWAEEFQVRAATLLLEMEQQYLDGYETVKPDIIAYTTIIGTFAKTHKPKYFTENQNTVYC